MIAAGSCRWWQSYNCFGSSVCAYWLALMSKRPCELLWQNSCLDVWIPERNLDRESRRGEWEWRPPGFEADSKGFRSRTSVMLEAGVTAWFEPVEVLSWPAGDSSPAGLQWGSPFEGLEIFFRIVGSFLWISWRFSQLGLHFRSTWSYQIRVVFGSCWCDVSINQLIAFRLIFVESWLNGLQPIRLNKLNGGSGIQFACNEHYIGSIKVDIITVNQWRIFVMGFNTKIVPENS